MNKVILMGRLTRDPEVRYSQGENATAIARYTLAVDRRFNRGGDENSADFIGCVAFGKSAEFAERYLHKGTKIVVTGRIQTGSYTNRDGVKVYTMTDAFVHTKSVLTEKCAIIGSANFDLRSFFQQYENALYTDDAAVMRGLSDDFAATFPECAQRRYVRERRGFFRSLLIALLQIFAPMM